MNKSSCTRVSFDFEHRFLPPVFILVFIIGLLANGWGLKSLLQNWKKLGIVNVFVLNLGLADILYLLTLPFLVVYYFMKSKWIFGDTFCKITRFCFNLNLYGSIGFLTCISMYRYLVIVHPVRVMGRITVTHSVGISVMVWFLNLNLWSRVLQKQKICPEWSNGVYIAHQISRGLVCLNSALNPLVYLHGNEDIPAQLRQLLQQARRMSSRLFLSNSSSVPVAQTADEVQQELGF
ncbi:P2Y purinoceptor 1-like [Perca flavescens]|uniref:P2Y purinoceptor 1-like n=1 Tax=Perca flavescens TaxID=8167 RepID=UPI00106DFE03|nr:P2Y purinoceptor 1-like [Perca flavescens]